MLGSPFIEGQILSNKDDSISAVSKTQTVTLIKDELKVNSIRICARKFYIGR